MIPEGGAMLRLVGGTWGALGSCISVMKSEGVTWRRSVAFRPGFESQCCLVAVTLGEL